MKRDQPLWVPSSEAMDTAPMRQFMAACRALDQQAPDDRVFTDDDAFHQWSIDQPEQFWTALWDYCAVKGERGDVALRHGGDMLAARFFPEARLNFAENLMSRRGRDDALVFWGEDKARDRWSWDRLHATVSRLQQAFKAAGINWRPPRSAPSGRPVHRISASAGSSTGLPRSSPGC